MMTAPAHPQRVILTYDDYLRFSDDGKQYEIIDGEAYLTPAPNTPHQLLSRNLEFILHAHVRKHDLGEILDAPFDVVLDRTNIVQPDILFIAKSRLGALSRQALHGPPDLAVEILSPGSEKRDREVKHQLYARHGVRYFWLIDLEARSLTEYVLEQRESATLGNSYRLHATYPHDARFESAIFPGLVIDLTEVFPASE